ncbi:nuclear transport factor 2 family protein [Maribacter chungangensis]|uniref:Nuclear transport factor 2 family protein n=1 Tax=Maribacter chungangensis TaxID=1069117 RepID=A0ABW3B346_9FLAO
MKKYILSALTLSLTPAVLLAQQNTEVFLMDVRSTEKEMTLTPEEVFKSLESPHEIAKRLGPPLNISNNEGYDNQPSFLDNDNILYASTRNNQTDIAVYNISTGKKTWISDTPGGSEYSPLKIPGKAAVSAIRLDSDGLQRLYEYDLQTGEFNELIKDLKVGYHVWYNDHIIVCTVLVANRMDLVVVDLKKGANTTVAQYVGRSLHKIPNTNLVSYISKADKTFKIKSLDPIKGTIKKLNAIWNGRDDIAWLSPHTILATNDKAIVQVPADTTGIWHVFHQPDASELYKMSRMAISPDGKKLAVVAEPSPNKIVQKQLERFNARDLDGFVNCYTNDVLVTNFPTDTISVGRQPMKEGYRKFYEKTPKVEVKVANRMVLGTTVIDHEVVTINDKQNLQVAVYEIDGRIKSMRFIRDKKVDESSETIVQKQLDAYNARDIDGFMDTYSENIALYNFPAQLRTQGQLAMRKGYGEYFESTPDLHAEIKNRIVIGNIVIDHEEVTANGTKFSAVAIYEVVNGKISKVTFVRE